MSTIGRANIRGNVPLAFKKMNKKVWTQEFKDSYRTSVREYEKPSDKKRKAKKEAIRKNKRTIEKRQAEHDRNYKRNMG